MPHKEIKDGTVLNGCFWLNDEPWLIERPIQPLKEYLAESLEDQRQYIARLTERADAMEKWLNEQNL